MVLQVTTCQTPPILNQYVERMMKSGGYYLSYFDYLTIKQNLSAGNTVYNVNLYNLANRFVQYIVFKDQLAADVNNTTETVTYKNLQSLGNGFFNIKSGSTYISDLFEIQAVENRVYQLVNTFMFYGSADQLLSTYLYGYSWANNLSDKEGDVTLEYTAARSSRRRTYS